ncbi:germin-like protein subfamily 3 member 4 [Euphorbia lathyris]|uniref:germin-like protein subfamily 3 member 4 n=1 Tax=Euphorbia lathyris TaxID=212925 RepID=UPI003313E71B
MPSFQSTMKLHQVSSLIEFNVMEMTNLKSLSEDSDNLQDICPAAPSSKQSVFINGLPCKNPANITSSDFKSLKLSQPGNTDNFFGSSTNIVTASDFPGLNTLGLSIARTDLDVDGSVLPQMHPRASEILFIGEGVVLAGFVDSQNQLFQKVFKEGEVFVIPRGLLHFLVNAGNEPAVVYSVLNSQNPGIMSIGGAMFEPSDPDLLKRLAREVKSFTASQVNGSQILTLFGLQSLYSH